MRFYIQKRTTPVKRKVKRNMEVIMTAAIGIPIGIGTEIDEEARNSTPIAIAICLIPA
jgi:LPS O-antigen subunit length determinant protein (WzzB/FepE family)